MKKFIILFLVFISRSFMSHPSFAMQLGQNRVTNGLICEGCQKEFKKAENRVEHVIKIHYACPWCSNLSYLDLGVWNSLSDNNLELRVRHIKKCAKMKKTSLWQCKECSALFHYAKTDHKCGVKHQVNLISGEALGIEVILKTERENTCKKCSPQRSLVTARACKNHLMREHVTCPWCSTQLAHDGRPFKELNMQEREIAHVHFIECAQKNNESLFGCDTCFGVTLCSRASHVESRCNGVVHQVSEKKRENSDVVKQEELSSSIEDSIFSNQPSDWHDERTMSSDIVLSSDLLNAIGWSKKEEEHPFSVDEFFVWYNPNREGSSSEKS